MTAAAALEQRARQSLGASADAIYETVDAVLGDRRAGGILADIGCGTGALWTRIRSRFDKCIGIDAVRYDGLPLDIEFRAADLDAPLPLADSSVDTAVALETIEHLENPRAFSRELARVVRSGGLVVVTTPNQLSGLSLLTLLAKQQFSAFQDNSYPAHRTALLESDLRRIFAECGLAAVDVRYTQHGRLPGTGAHYPKAVSRVWPRLLSDNLVVAGVKTSEVRN